MALVFPRTPRRSARVLLDLVVLLYLPMRLSWRRQVQALRRALRGAPDDRTVDGFLAWRAVLNLPYDRLREVSTDPWSDLEAGRYRKLGDAELRRLGIDRPAARR